MATSAIFKDASNNTGLTFITIADAGTTASAPFDCIGMRPFALVTWDDFTACSLTFQTLPFSANLAVAPGAVVNSDLANLANFDGTNYTIAAQAGKQQIPLDPSVFCNVRYINITCGSSQTTGGRFMLVLQPIWQGIHN
jgi:hypothetical protein